MSYVDRIVGTRYDNFDVLAYKVQLAKMIRDGEKASATRANKELTDDLSEAIRYTWRGTACLMVGAKAVPDENPGNYIDLRVLY